MKTQKALCAILAVCAFAGAAMLPRQARARACTVASDCPKGWDCAVAAADGGPTGTCMSLPCQGNSDCGPGLSCYIWGWSLGPGVPASATTQSLFPPQGGQGSACLPQWEVACTSASDCGPGFTCPSTAGDFGGFGGSFNCGKDQDASEPPQATVTTVPCSAVPTPPFPHGDAGLPPGFSIPSICEAGTTCTRVTWNDCVAPQSTPCSRDSDCPPTWTCGCETNCNGPVLASDGGCMTVCMAPNSDLFAGEICNGTAGGGVSFGAAGSTPPPSSPAPEGGGGTASGASPRATTSPSGHGGGCNIGSGPTSASWTLLAMGGLAWARRRPRRRTRAS